MQAKPISPLAHSVIDYVLAGSLIALPTALNFNKQVKYLYAAEAVTLLIYVAVTKTPAAIKPLIPFRVHGTIDPFNVATFAVQTFTKPFRKQKKAALFNVVFTLLAGTTVLLTNWAEHTER